MKIGDKVKIKVGPHSGKIGVVKRVANGEDTGFFHIELPKFARYCLFTEGEIEGVPTTPRPLEDVNQMIRLAANRVVTAWRAGCTMPVLNLEIQTLEKALLN